MNNAGLAPENPAEDVREEDFDLTLAVNLKGTFFASQAAGRVMIRQKYGRIVNLGSQAGFIALPTESVYCMTKAAISHLTKCLAVEWARHNITVNAVAPTFIRTPGTAECLANDAFRADVLSRIPLGRIGEPMEVAAGRALPRVAGGGARHRHDPAHRRGLDGALSFAAQEAARIGTHGLPAGIVDPHPGQGTAPRSRRAIPRRGRHPRRGAVAACAPPRWVERGR